MTEPAGAPKGADADRPLVDAVEVAETVGRRGVVHEEAAGTIDALERLLRVRLR